MEEVNRLVKAKDHHGVLTHIRANKLRQPQHVVAAGTALLGPEVRRSGGLGLSERLAVLEQMVMASIDVGDMELAERCLGEIKKSAPEDSARYRRLLGLCLEAAGDLNGAEQEYDDLLAENPSNKFALKRKYCILRAQPGKEVQAREAFNTLLESAGGDPASWAEFGRVAQEAGDYKAAIYAWEEVVLACPLSADVHCTLGELYATLGGIANLRLARKHIAQSLDLDPANTRALYALVASASAYLDELDRASKSKRDAEDDGAEVARELVKFGAEQLVKQYAGSKMQKVVAEVMQIHTST